MALRCVWVVLSADHQEATLACASGTSAMDIALDMNVIASRPEVLSFSVEESKLKLNFYTGSGKHKTFLSWLAENQPKVEVPDGYQPVQATILWPELPFPKKKGSDTGGGKKGRIIHM